MASANPANNPKNVGIIMDGNGRWAKQNSLITNRGHEKGVAVVKEVVKEAVRQKLQSLTLYAFSTENWSRPKKEISGIKRLIIEAIHEQVPELAEQKVKLNFFGDIETFGKKVHTSILKAENDTSFTKPALNLNIALGYGGRSDIINGIRTIVDEAKKTKKDLQIDETSFFNYLSAPINDLDVLIRTGGDHRISNFLLYHIAYTELIFVDKLWPDFSSNDFQDCLNSFKKRNRRFGKRV